jgi:heat-inducible transcriptional repressor
MSLDTRQRAILQTVVELFVDTAEPVSSGAVAKRIRELSSATVRAAMAELEELGLLHQPHTSAGRVPTEHGLRLYLDGLLRPRLRPRDRDLLDAVATAPPNELLGNLGQSLAGLSGQVAVVAVPKLPGPRLKEIGLVRYDERRFLAVFVSPGGLVHQKLVEVDFDPAPAILAEAQSFINDKLQQLSLPQLRDLIQQEIHGERGVLAALRREALEIGARALSGAPAPRELELIVEGTAHLVGQPEFADLQHLRRLLEAIDERTAVLELLMRVLDGAGVRVMLGSEHQVRGLPEVACVGGACIDDDGRSAAITLLGPARMDYGRLVPLVGYATNLLGRSWRLP